MPVEYFLPPGKTLADGKLLVRGMIPAITQHPQIEYSAVLVPGVEATITRAQWEDGYAPVETLTLDGVDVIGDTTDNLDGTWTYTATTPGRLRYAAYPDNGAAYAGRAAIVDEVTVPVALGDLAIVIDDDEWTVTRETWLYADSASIEVTLDGAPVGLTGTFTNADDGKTLTATETATNAEGSATAEVSQTYFANLEPPINTSLPTIAWSGNDWAVTPGTWTGADSVSTVVTLGGMAVGLTGTLIAADDGKTLLVAETATNGDGTTGPVTVSDVVAYVPPVVSFLASSSSSDSLTITLPAGIQAGDLCLITSVRGYQRSMVTPSGFSAVGSGFERSPYLKVSVFQKTLTGTETTLTVFSGSASRIASHAMVFRNAEVVGHAYSTSGQNTSDPPSVAAVADGAAVIVGGFATTAGTGGLTTMPTGYTQTVHIDPGSSQDAGIIVGYKLTSTTGTEDPGAFTYRSTAFHGVVTIALGPV